MLSQKLLRWMKKSANCQICHTPHFVQKFKIVCECSLKLKDLSVIVAKSIEAFLSCSKMLVIVSCLVANFKR